MISIKQRILSSNLWMLCALLAGAAIQVHAQEPPLIHLSDEDKIAIVESVLQDEFMVPREEFRDRTLSSENLEFIEPSRLSELRSKLLSSACRASSNQMLEYLVFRKIEASGNNVMVTVSRVLESNPCFGRKVSSTQTLIYRYHIESGRWTGELISKTPRPLSKSTQWSRATGASLRIRDTR